MKFLRHFQTEVDPETPVSKWELSEEGKEEMQRFIQETSFDCGTVYTSTEPKAVETAERLAEENDLEIVRTDLLREVDRSEEGFVEDHDRYVELAEGYLRGGDEADWEDQEKVRKRFNEFIRMAESGSLVVTHGLFLSLNIPDGDSVVFWHELGFGQLVHHDF